jgi:hypothetical protein
MKHLFSILLCATLFCSCYDDEETAYKIKYVLRANTDSTIEMWWPNPRLLVREYYEYEDTIKESDATYAAMLHCHCEDPNTLLMGEIYIDGALKAKDSAYTLLKMTYRFK